MTIVVKDGNGAPQTIPTISELMAMVATQTTSAAILAKLITSPATEAKQDTGNTSLASIDTKLTTIAGYVDGLEALATALNGYVDGLEALAAAATPAGELHIGEVGGNTAVVGGSFTRPANTTPYASGQLVANSATAGSIVPVPCSVARKNDGTGVLQGLRLSKSGPSLTNAAFRVHLFKTAPTSSVGDAGTFAGAVTGVAALALGYYDITMDQSYSDGAKGFVAIPGKAFDAAAGSQNIYALIEARGAYTPTSSETFTVALESLRD